MKTINARSPMPGKYAKAKAETQADRAVAMMIQAGGHVPPDTHRMLIVCLKSLAQYIKNHPLGDLQHTTRDIAQHYLASRTGELRQSVLETHRTAISHFLWRLGVLPEGEKLPPVHSEVNETSIKSGHYSQDDVRLVCEHMTDKYVLATELVHACGLRPHELFTLRLGKDRPMDYFEFEHRTKKPLLTRFCGRSGVIYTVEDGRGFVREVMVPTTLSRRLESRRHRKPQIVKDDLKGYETVYDLPGGNRWAASFARASHFVLGWSGVLRLRDAYRAERTEQLRLLGFAPNLVSEIVAQEMGVEPMDEFE